MTTAPEEHFPNQPVQRAGSVWSFFGGCGLVMGLAFLAVVALLIYIASKGPDTSVYTGNRVPATFLRIVEDVGALEEGEAILYFYSDALSDIRDGFYFVSNKKVVVYSENSAEKLTAIPFEEILDVYIYRNESMFDDSEITLRTSGDRVISFPVSSEYDRDQEFFEAIRAKASNLRLED